MTGRIKVPGVIKNVIAPVQSWLLGQGRCVGCGRELSTGARSKKGAGEKVTCSCGRIFIYEIKGKSYRRALLNEA